MTAPDADYYRTLQIAANSDSHAIRTAYLALVTQFPPDREPDRFREIHHAYQMLNDPLAQAQEILKAEMDVDKLIDLVDQAAQRMARLPVLALLALGDEA